MGLASGLWCYILPLADPLQPSAYEMQCISDFAENEKSHGRKLGVWVQEDKVRPQICQAITDASNKNPTERILPSKHNSICCRSFHPEGCDGRFVCHAAPAEAAQQIIEDGFIYSKHRLTGLGLDELADQGTWGDPADYFDYVALARGNCVAPDIVAMSRQFGRDLSPQEADEGFFPGVRFFFDLASLMQHPRAVWDGIHPIKIRDNLELNGNICAVVAPEFYPNGGKLHLQTSTHLNNKIIYLDHHKLPSLMLWSNAALEAVET